MTKKKPQTKTVTFNAREFIHKKTEKRYLFLGEGRDTTNRTDGVLVQAIYIDPETMRLYCRHIDEFEAKFEEVLHGSGM